MDNKLKIEDDIYFELDFDCSEIEDETRETIQTTIKIIKEKIIKNIINIQFKKCTCFRNELGYIKCNKCDLIDKINKL